MNDQLEKHEDSEQGDSAAGSRIERFGRILFLFGGGILLSALVSCACGPTR